MNVCALEAITAIHQLCCWQPLCVGSFGTIVLIRMDQNFGIVELVFIVYISKDCNNLFREFHGYVFREQY